MKEKEITEIEARGRKVRASDMQCYCCAATQLGADRLGSSFERHELGQSPVQPNGRARQSTYKKSTYEVAKACNMEAFSTRDGQAVFVPLHLMPKRYEAGVCVPRRV